MIITSTQQTDWPAVVELLTTAVLPLAGLEACFDTAVVARLEEQIVGFAALELYPPDALLRSVVVAPSQRGTGLGQALTEAALALAQERGITAVYLLTTTAADFFPRFGFERVERTAVSPTIQNSVEFTTACPASAQAMRLRLDEK